MSRWLTAPTCLLLLLPLTLHAQMPDPDAGKQPEKSRLSIGGYVESINYYGISIERTMYSLNGLYRNEDGEEFTISKFEAHAKIDARYDFLDNVYLKTITYLHAATAATPTLRRYFGDLEIVNVQELYLSVQLGPVDIRAGNRLIKWGPAYTISPTSYFNPFDLIEIVLRDPEELYVGIPAASANVSWGDVALQIVYAPVHTPTRLPERGGPWALRVPNVQIPGSTVSVPVEMAPINNAYVTYDRHSIDDYSVGARLSATMHGLDVSLSAYHGYDRDIVLFPTLVPDPKYPLGKIELAPYYSKVTSLGVDFAIPVWEFTLYGEAAYTFDKPAIVRITNLAELNEPLRHTGFLYCVLGVNWVYDQYFRVAVEYLQGAYIGNKDPLIDPFFSNLLSGTIEKQILDGAVILEFKGIFNTWKHDAVLMPSIGWQLQDNLLAEIGLSLFIGNPDTLFGSYRGRDLVNLKLRYLF